MYIQRRTVRYWSNLAKSFQDEADLLTGHRISRLKVLALLRYEMLASKQIDFANAITLNVNGP
ncbi:MAG: hypothetical protein GY761_15070 [Hyphomicrobiales bacterium]|nr:hypothetical protein [Hyphomicrobiales bacterium]